MKRYGRCEHRHHDGTRCTKEVAMLHWSQCEPHAWGECRRCATKDRRDGLSESEMRYLDGDR